MTDIEKQALDLVNEVRAERDLLPYCSVSRKEDSLDEALCRAIEMLEAHKREVSDAVKAYFDEDYRRKQGEKVERISCFIIPDPVDQLVEAINAVWYGEDVRCYPKDADALRTAMKARGYAFTKIEEGQP